MASLFFCACRRSCCWCQHNPRSAPNLLFLMQQQQQQRPDGFIYIPYKSTQALLSLSPPFFFFSSSYDDDDDPFARLSSDDDGPVIDLLLCCALLWFRLLFSSLAHISHDLFFSYSLKYLITIKILVSASCSASMKQIRVAELLLSGRCFCCYLDGSRRSSGCCSLFFSSFPFLPRLLIFDDTIKAIHYFLSPLRNSLLFFFG